MADELTPQELTAKVTAQLRAALQRPRRYSLGDVLEFTEVERNRLMRWLDAGIIETAGGGSQGKRREFSFRNLVEVRVCDELRGLAMSEAGLRDAVRNLNTVWNQPDDPINHRDPNGPTYRDAAILWIALKHYDDGDVMATAPITPDNLISRLTDGAVDGSGIAETGIAIPIARIIADLEATTGDTFA